MRHKDIVRGIIICLVVLFIAFCVMLATPAKAYEGERITTAKQDALHNAADILRSVGYAEDSEVIKALQAEWWREQEDLDIIAKVIQHEADPQWCAWEHSVAVGAVVCNRVKSPHFKGDTVREIVAAPGQYLESYTRNFSGTSRLAYEAAKAALDGDHDVPSDCYWQDNKVQGVSVWKSFVCETPYGFRSTTYICRGIPGVS